MSEFLVSDTVKPVTNSQLSLDELRVESRKPRATAHHGPRHPGGTKLDARKNVRYERAQLLKEIMENKPDMTYDDPGDVAVIKQAKANMGDYKLKSADNYVVPADMRLDAGLTLKELRLLQASLFKVKEVLVSSDCRTLTRKSLIFVQRRKRLSIISRLIRLIFGNSKLIWRSWGFMLVRMIRGFQRLRLSLIRRGYGLLRRRMWMSILHRRREDEWVMRMLLFRKSSK